MPSASLQDWIISRLKDPKEAAEYLENILKGEQPDEEPYADGEHQRLVALTLIDIGAAHGVHLVERKST